MTKVKPDFDRVGFFSELSYTTIGDPYQDPGKRLLDFNRIKGRQLFGIYARSRCGLGHGYFSEFQRTFAGEGVTNMRKIRSEEKLASSRMRIGPVYVPASHSKEPNGSGTYYGTFTRNLPYFSTATIKPKMIHSGRNILSCPPKKGTGYGYANVTINKFPPYESSPFTNAVLSTKEQTQAHKLLLGGRREFIAAGQVECFDSNPYKSSETKQSLPSIPPRTTKGGSPSNVIVFRPPNPPKLPGGCAAGTFNPFPSHLPEPYQEPYKIQQKAKESRTFMSTSIPKSTRTESILTVNIKKYITPRNYKTVNKVMDIACC